MKKSNPARRSLLTKASLNCQKVGFTRSLTEDGRTARRVQAVLKHNPNSLRSAFSCPANLANSLALWEMLKYWPPVRVSRP